MKKSIFIALLMICSVTAWAQDSIDEMPADSIMPATEAQVEEEEVATTNEKLEIQIPQMGEITYKNWLGEDCIDFGNNSKTYYNWKRDITYAGVPLFLSSFIIKNQKKAFRSARFSMYDGWSSKVDNYTQFAPYAAIVGMKAFGYNGRSSWDRMLTSALLSNAVMAVIVNATKYSVKEMRPDNSTANSFPSGHTATAFAAATVLHKEYGLTRSPWFSVGGYAVAIGTGFMRVLNNRHWISDVIAGAGIGIMSTELGYFIGDLIYRNHGITRKELEGMRNTSHPSFFDIQMGLTMHSKTLTADYGDGERDAFELGTSTSVGVEGAYFLNKYVGLGGMVRVTTTPAKGIGLTSDDLESFTELNELLEQEDMPGVYNVKTSNNNFVDMSFNGGLYGNLPLNRYFSLGAKFLLGARVSNGFEYKGQMGFRTPARDAHGMPIYTGVSATGSPDDWDHVWMFERADGTVFNSNETLMPGVSTDYNYHLDPDRYKSDEYTMMKVKGGTSLNYVVGLSATFHYKDNFSWKLFVDFDSAKNKYSYNVNLFEQKTMNKIKNESPALAPLIEELQKIESPDTKFSSRFNLITLGAAFSVNF